MKRYSEVGTRVWRFWNATVTRLHWDGERSIPYFPELTMRDLLQAAFYVGYDLSKRQTCGPRPVATHRRADQHVTTDWPRNMLGNKGITDGIRSPQGVWQLHCIRPGKRAHYRYQREWHPGEERSRRGKVLAQPSLSRSALDSVWEWWLHADQPNWRTDASSTVFIEPADVIHIWRR